MTNPPIVINLIDGHPVAGGPAAVVNAALHGQAALTITGKHATGDVVWLAGRQVWRDDAVQIEHVARTVTHAQHGEIVYAYVDTARLDQAPALTERLRAAGQAAAAAEQRARAMVPSCDNCGDCRECV